MSGAEQQPDNKSRGKPVGVGDLPAGESDYGQRILTWLESRSLPETKLPGPAQQEDGERPEEFEVGEAESGTDPLDPVIKETATEPLADINQHRAKRLRRASWLLTFLGTIGGAWYATQVSDVELAPGLTVAVSPQLSGHSTVSLGPLDVNLPAAHQDIKLPKTLGGNVPVGAHLVVTEVNTIASGGNLLDDMAAIKDQPQQLVMDPVQSAIIRRGAIGAGAGLVLITAGLGAGYAANRRHRGKDESQSSKKTKLESALHLGVPVVLASTLAAGVGYEHMQPNPAGASYLLDSTCTNHLPVLEGASMTTDAAKVANILCKKAVAYSGHTDSVWRTDARAIGLEVNRLRQNGGLEWQNDPNNVVFLHATDIHASLPYMKYFLPEIVRQFEVRTIILTGDQQNVAGTLPIDAAAYSTLLEALAPENIGGIQVKIIDTLGNHDAKPLPPNVANYKYHADGKTWDAITSLDAANHYTYRRDGITYAGAPDTNTTTFNGTTPTNPNAQMQNDASAGEYIAQAVCRAHKIGQKNIVAAGHEPQMLYAALASGCAPVVTLAGHLHVTLPSKTFVNPDGSVSTEQVLGSASGAGPNDYASIEGTPTVYAPTRLDIINKHTHRLIGTVTITAYPNRAPTVRYKPAKHTAGRTAMQSPGVSSFLTTFDASYQRSSLQSPGRFNGAAGQPSPLHRLRPVRHHR